MSSNPTTVRQDSFMEALDRVTPEFWGRKTGYSFERVIWIREKDAYALLELAFGMKKDSVRLCALHVAHEHRRRGWGTAAMEWICDTADQTGLKIELSVRPWGYKPPLKKMELKRWYKRFGFVPVRGDRFQLYREPEPSRLVA
jgi:GNAT superfamily N-acetyltransferase